MASKSGLFYAGLLLIFLAVAYQYRTDIARLLQQFTSASSKPGTEKDEIKTKRSSQERQTPVPTKQGGRDESRDPPTVEEFYNPPFDPDHPSEELRSDSGTRLYTRNELAAHGPNGPLKPILLSILGRVYDVSKGKDYYGPNGGYKFFAGTDGTRAFVTGEFDEEGLIDAVEGLSPLQMGEIDGWVKFYDKSYIFVGKLIGR